MKQEEYYIDRTTHKHQYYGLAGTLLFHGILVIALVFYVLYPPNPPLEFEGIKMSLGEENMGGPSQEPVQDPQPNETYTPITEQPDDATLSADNDENVEIKDQVKKDTPKKKPVIKIAERKNVQMEQPVQKINEQAMFKKRNNANGEGGRGDGSIPGNQGMENGDENGDPNGRGMGDSGFGTSDKGPDGIQIDFNRKVRSLPNIEDNSRAVGKVVVRIVVNRDGEVIKAVPGQVGSTTTEQSLLDKAREGALKTRFAPSNSGPDEQFGTMTFVFRFKP